MINIDVTHEEFELVKFAATLTYLGMEDFPGADEFRGILERVGVDFSRVYRLEEFNERIERLSEE